MRSRHSRSRSAHSHGLTLFVMLVMSLAAIDSSNIMDANSAPEFRESLATVMLMDLLVITYLTFRDVRRFRLTSEILTATFHILAAGPGLAGWGLPAWSHFN